MGLTALLSKIFPGCHRLVAAKSLHFLYCIKQPDNMQKIDMLLSPVCLIFVQKTSLFKELPCQPKTKGELNSIVNYLKR